MFKREKGITLIALVVTIIILLILAGVTLSLALTQNGIFDQARKAADSYDSEQHKDANTINEIANIFQQYDTNGKS